MGVTGSRAPMQGLEKDIFDSLESHLVYFLVSSLSDTEQNGWTFQATTVGCDQGDIFPTNILTDAPGPSANPVLYSVARGQRDPDLLR